MKRSDVKRAFLGSRVRALRRERSFTQAAFAKKVGISPSYLNLIEHNQRAVTVPLLISIAQVLDVDMKDIAQDEKLELMGDVRTILADSLLGDYDIPDAELHELSVLSPSICKIVRDLYNAYRSHDETISALVERLAIHGDQLSGDDDPIAALPYEEVSDFIQDANNHFPVLEDAAEQLWCDASLASIDLHSRLIAYLDAAHRTDVRIAPPQDMQGAGRHFNAKRHSLTFSELLSHASRTFQIARQIGVLEHTSVFESLLAGTSFSNANSRDLAMSALANYYAGAVVMPYAAFLDAAEDGRYDIDVLENRFAASFEQVCHRLTSLSRPDASGVPFHLVRVDIAGNISKRFSASGIRIARYSAGCPRWNVHRAFMAPNRIRVQLSVMPDGRRYICVARAVRKLGGGFRHGQSYLSIGIGCEARYAERVTYADTINFEDKGGPVPIGVSCRTCERDACPQRAFPSVT